MPLYPPVRDNNSSYKTLLATGAKATTAATTSTKYWMFSAATDNTTIVAASNNAVGEMVYLASADHAVTGLTTKLRLRVAVLTATAPAITITFNLYSIQNSAGTLSLNATVSGSTVAVATPAANSNVVQDSGDFTFPADGLYGIGYTVSGTAAANYGAQAFLDRRNV